jgi:hypothetical protein
MKVFENINKKDTKINKEQNRQMKAVGNRKAGVLLLAWRSPETNVVKLRVTPEGV